MKILCGQYAADAGEVVFAGSVVEPTGPLEAERLGLVMIHQELNLVPGLTVAENIFLGHEPTAGGSDRRWADVVEARDLLRRLECEIDPDTPVSELSVAEQQLVEIARALQRKARLLVMDEPSAALSDTEIDALFGGDPRSRRQWCAGDLHLAPDARDLRHRRSGHRHAGWPDGGDQRGGSDRCRRAHQPDGGADHRRPCSEA